MEISEARDDDGSRKYHLDILLNTLVTRIRLDEGDNEKPKARGVDYLRGESLYRSDPRSSGREGVAGFVYAGKEVIIPTGAFNTLQLLKLSGIGPKRELNKFGIHVVVDLPGVGTNLQDRYQTTVISETDADFKLTGKCTWLESMPDPCLEDWKQNGSVTSRGGYTSNGIALAVLKRSSTAPDEIPDLLITGAPAWFTGYYQGYSTRATADSKHWTWIVFKSHTRNTAGFVLLRTASLRDTPVITFNYFYSGTTTNGAADLDAQAIVDGMESARQAIEDVPAIPSKFKEV